MKICIYEHAESIVRFHYIIFGNRLLSQSIVASTFA